MVIFVTKIKMINVRLGEQTHKDFKIACELKGGGMAQILHQFIVKTIREEKEREPQAFLESIRPNLTPKNGIQEQPGLHRLDEGKNKRKGEKQAEEIIKNLDIENFDMDYGDFNEDEEK